MITNTADTITDPYHILQEDYERAYNEITSRFNELNLNELVNINV